MKVLLWKDCRVNRMVIILGTAMVLGPYVFGLGGEIYFRWRHDFAWWDYSLASNVAYVSLALLVVTMAMLGGNAFAAERADRSAEFLAYLPPSRWTLVASKMIVALGASLSGWALNLLTLFVVAPRLPGVPQLMEDNPKGEALLAGAGFAALVFGVAWCFSSFVATPAIATGGGFFAPLLAAGVLQSLDYFFHPAGFSFGSWYGRLSLPVGIVAFVVGTVVYVRRVEP
jgi:hypothetical protein